MPRLSAAQIAGYAAGAGFSGKGLSTAIAVALAESGGRTDATGPVGEKGLWQVYPKAHPDWDRGGNLYDPAYNARAAFSISNRGTNWHPWTTYNIGTYLLYLPTAERAAQGAKPISGPLAGIAAGTGPAAGFGAGENALSKIPGVPQIEAVGKAVTFLSNPAHWYRIAEVIAGAILVVLALWRILAPVIEPAAKTAVKVGAAVA